MGTTGNFDGEFAQIYQGKGLKILSVCQGKEARRLGVNLHRIAKLAAGDSEEFLSDLVNSKGMDLDNIDNIFRASSAMGILSEECGELAKMLANSFMIKELAQEYASCTGCDVKNINFTHFSAFAI